MPLEVVGSGNSRAADFASLVQTLDFVRSSPFRMGNPVMSNHVLVLRCSLSAAAISLALDRQFMLSIVFVEIAPNFVGLATTNNVVRIIRIGVSDWAGRSLSRRWPSDTLSRICHRSRRWNGQLRVVLSIGAMYTRLARHLSRRAGMVGIVAGVGSEALALARVVQGGLVVERRVVLAG